MDKYREMLWLYVTLIEWRLGGFVINNRVRQLMRNQSPLEKRQTPAIQKEIMEWRMSNPHISVIRQGRMIYKAFRKDKKTLTKKELTTLGKMEVIQQYKRPADKAFGEWLAGALTRHAISPSELSRKAGVTRQSVSYWMETGRIAIKQVPKLEKIFGELSPATLAAQTSIYTVDTLEPQRHNTVYIPLLTVLNAGNADLSNFTGERTPICFATVEESLNLFAIQIERTLSPIFIRGDIVYIDTKRELKNNDHVLLKFQKNEEAIFRVYRKEAGRISLTCESEANKNYYDLIENDFSSIGVATGKFSNLV